MKFFFLALAISSISLILPARAEAPCAQMPILKPVEPVVLMGAKLQLKVTARIDTGAEMSSLDSVLAKRLGLDQNIIGEITVRNAHGTSRRKVVRLKYLIKGQVRSSDFSLIPRQGLGELVLVGRRSLKGFLVDPGADCAEC